MSHFRPVGRKKFILHRFFQKSSSNTPIDHGEHSDSRNEKNDFEPPMNRKRHDILQRDIAAFYGNNNENDDNNENNLGL